VRPSFSAGPHLAGFLHYTPEPHWVELEDTAVNQSPTLLEITFQGRKPGNEISKLDRMLAGEKGYGDP